MRYATNSSTSGDIRDHLQICNSTFAQALSNRVNIAEYAAKIRNFAVTFECWSGDRLVGLVAAYENADASDLFITSVSTVPTFVRQGIARHLMVEAIEFAKSRSLNSVRLEVDVGSEAAVNLYKSLQFRLDSDHAGDNDQQVMVRDLLS